MATAPVLEEQPTVERKPVQQQSTRRIALRVMADAMAVLTALFLASTIRFELFNDSPTITANYTVVTLIATPVWLILFKLYGLYEPRQVLGPVIEFKQVFHGVVAGTVLII